MANDLTTTATDERDLVRRARGGSLEAGEELLARHWPRAWRAAYAVLGEPSGAEDAAQGAVERAFTHLDRFDERRPFGPWLTRIAVNQALNMVRARRDELPLDVECEAGGDPYAGIVDRDEIVRAVGALAMERRLVVVLRYWADLDPREIAEVLGIPVGTVTSRLARAMNDLRAELEEVRRP